MNVPALLWATVGVDLHYCLSLSIGDPQPQSLGGIPALACITLCDQHTGVHGLLPHRVPLYLLAITNMCCKLEDYNLLGVD